MTRGGAVNAVVPIDRAACELLTSVPADLADYTIFGHWLSDLGYSKVN